MKRATSGFTLDFPGGLGVSSNEQSKYAYYLEHQADALKAYEGSNDMFSAADTALLGELRVVFDWMAEETNATKMSSRMFKRRLPEIHKKVPFLSSNFRRMDANGDCWLEWHEFAEFCLRDPRVAKMMQRARTITVYGLEKNCKRTYKEQHDPSQMCETSVSPPLLPWEVSHVVEWRIQNLSLSRKGSPVMYGGVVVRPGRSLASPPFLAAGVNGFLRFWPTSYWTETQRRKKRENTLCEDDEATGLFENNGSTVRRDLTLPPHHTSWCSIGLFVPEGTRIHMRFFVLGGATSDVRENYWNAGVHPNQIWSPPETEAPPDWKEGDSVTVGVEIFRNHNALHSRPGGRRYTTPAQRSLQRPSIPTTMDVKNSKLLGGSRSVPLVRSMSSPDVRSSTAKMSNR